MPFVTPEEIEAKAANAYNQYLRAWIRREAEEFFAHRLRVNLEIDVSNPSTAIAASERLLERSKNRRNWGYTVHREEMKKRGFGSNLIPHSVTIDTLDDLLRLSNNRIHFERTSFVADRVRQSLPTLESWLVSHVSQLHTLADSIEGLIRVTDYFMRNPWPDCYARQLPVPVDTKFVSRNTTTLRQWFDLLLPASSIDVNESKFERRFGLRDGRPHRAIRVLDPELLVELRIPFDELSLPLALIAKLPVKGATVFIVENDLNLLTLPGFPRGIAIRGEGNAVNRLEVIHWLQYNRIIYWGDIDVDGFVILSRLRNMLPHTESIMMDVQTLDANQQFAVGGNDSSPPIPTNLTYGECEAFQRCLRATVRLEQEKVLQSYVEGAFARYFPLP